MEDPIGAPQLPPLKKLVVVASGLLTLVGIYDALTNLPVVSGCAFCGECHRESFRDPPGELGRDVPRDAP